MVMGKRGRDARGGAETSHSNLPMPEPLTEVIPLATDSDGVWRVGGTRVPLDTVVFAFDAGATPEQIAQDYPVLQLDDTYAVLTYYLRHTEEVNAYLERRCKLAAEMRRRWDARSSQQGLRDRLLARPVSRGA
jgi:uncharacterized protein (DUF433 family)